MFSSYCEMIEWFFRFCSLLQVDGIVFLRYQFSCFLWTAFLLVAGFSLGCVNLLREKALGALLHKAIHAADVSLQNLTASAKWAWFGFNMMSRDIF